MVDLPVTSTHIGHAALQQAGPDIKPPELILLAGMAKSMEEQRNSIHIFHCLKWRQRHIGSLEKAKNQNHVRRET